MEGVLARLFDALQRLKRVSPATAPDGARWYVARRGEDLEGPYLAAELAWLSLSRRLAADDHVVNGATGERHRAGSDTFLRRWRDVGDADRARLVRALTNAVRRASTSVVARQTSQSDAPPLTPEQRRAFHLLRLDPRCSPGEAKARLRTLAARHHPDRGGSLERMQEITWAWRVVEDAVG